MKFHLEKTGPRNIQLIPEKGDPFRGYAQASRRLSEWAETFGLDENQIKSILTRTELMLEGDKDILELELEETGSMFDLYVRKDMTSPESFVVKDGNPRDAMAQALTYRYTRGDIRWENKLDLCVVDMDGDPITAEETLEMRAKLECRPAFLWLSKSKGVHLVYTRYRHFSAIDRACAAAVELKELLPRFRIELLSNTRFPPGTYTTVAESNGNLVWPWRKADKIYSVEDSEVEAWLQRNELTFARHPHERCPFNPHLTSGAPSVDVNPNGIKCYTCAAKGGKHWASWAELVGYSPCSRIEEAARELVTWEQAEHIVKADWPHELPDFVLKNAYKALCVELAPEANRPEAYRTTREYGIIRGAGNVWLDSKTLHPISMKVGERRLAMLPSVRYFNGKKFRPDPVKLDRYCTNQPLRGWAPIVPVFGIRLYPPLSKTYIYTVAKSDKIYPPRYIPTAQRKSPESVNEELRHHFPGLNINYLSLCILARAYAESGEGPVPIVIVAGPTGAGKSATIRLAAEMLGDRAITILDSDDLLNAVGSNCGKGGFMLIDEFGKRNKIYRTARSSLFDPILNMQREFGYRELYVGNIVKRLASAIFITNTSFPQEALSHQQAGRRSVYLELVRRAANWYKTAGEIDKLRERKDFAFLFDCFISNLMDTHLVSPVGWTEATERLDFAFLEAFCSENAEMDMREEILEFFIALHETPDVDGWLLVSHGTKAMKAWLQIADTREKGTPDSSERITERDLVETLRYDHEDRDDRAIRFFSRPTADGVKIRLLLTKTYNYKPIKVNKDVLSLCKLD